MQSLKDTIADHRNNYNLIRLFLAASVIFYHSFSLCGISGYDNPIDAFLVSHGPPLGDLAVGCFFFLSGMFVTQSYHRDSGPADFFIRRFCRLWPPYFVCLCVTATLACIVSQGDARSVLTSDFIDYIAQNADFSMAWKIPGVFEGRADSTINGSIHTMPTEVTACVLVFALGCFVSFRKMRNVICAVGISLALTVLYYHLVAIILMVTGRAHMPLIMFLSGAMTVAFAQYVKPYLWFGGISLLLALFVPAPVNTPLLFAFAAWAMIYAGQMKGLWIPRADFSYGIYIYGWPSQQIVATYAPLNPYLHTLLSLLLATAFAAVSWYAIEKPSIRLGRKVIAGMPPALRQASFHYFLRRRRASSLS